MIAEDRPTGLDRRPLDTPLTFSDDELDMTVQSIYLVGPMGAGKTTVGRRVAEVYGLAFVDLDEEIVRRCGAPIDWIFDIEGEAGFREREHEALCDLTSSGGPLLIATGGGVILNDDNRKRLAAGGLVVYLATTVDQQINRLRNDKSRPLLRAPDRRQKLQLLAKERNALYASIADVTVETGGSSVKTAREVVAAIERFRNGTDTEQPRTGSC